MIVASLLFLTLATVSQGFAPQHQQSVLQNARQGTQLYSDFGSAMPTTVSSYERIGIDEDDMAVDVDPDLVIKYIGTREDMIEKALKDIPSFDRAQAEENVDKFLMDSDAIKVYIEFNRRRSEDPDFKVPGAEEDEGFFTVRNVALAYLGYVGVTAGPDAARNFVAAKEAAGEWSGTGIEALDSWLTTGGASQVVDSIN